MEPEITMPLRTTREQKDRNKSAEKLTALDYDEFDSIIDRKPRKAIFGGNIINVFPNAGEDGWYPTEEEINMFLEEHKPLLKKDFVFLRWLRTLDPNSLFAKNSMTESQKKAYEIVMSLDLDREKKETKDSK